MENNTQKYEIRHSFQDFLSDMVRAAFPHTYNSKKEKVMPGRCPKAIEELIKYIERDAYSQASLHSNSMLNAIDLAMHQEYRHLLQQVDNVKNHSTDDAQTEEKPPKSIIWNSYVKLLLRCFPENYPTELPVSCEDFHTEMLTFTESTNNKWYSWIDKDTLPRGRFSLIRLLLYGILCPRFEAAHAECPTDSNLRIREFFNMLLSDYLQCTLSEIEYLDDFLQFSWNWDYHSPIALSTATSAFISVVLFLSCLSAFGEFSDNEEAFTIQAFVSDLRDRFLVSNTNYKAFEGTQTETIFYVNPYLKGISPPPRLSNFLPPAKLPWDNDTFAEAAPVRFNIIAPPAQGKTQLFRAIGRVLTKKNNPASQRSSINILANQLLLPNDASFITVALNAQQFKWYCDNYSERNCNDFVDMFFRSTLEHNGESENTVDTVMNTIISEKLNSANQDRRLFFLFDGYDELMYSQLQDIFFDALEKFIRNYPNAIVLLFSRPTAGPNHVQMRKLGFKEFSSGITHSDISHTSDRLQDAMRVPLIKHMYTQKLFSSLPDAATHYVFRVIDKVYDFPSRISTPQLWDNKRSFIDILEELAWHFSVQPNASIIRHLGKLLMLPEKENYEDIHRFAQQSGVLEWDYERRDYRFSSIHTQALLAAAYIRESIKWQFSTHVFRNVLHELPDEISLEIMFTLIHTVNREEPLFAEALLLDFAFRPWCVPCQSVAENDLDHMLKGNYGETPVQLDKNNTLRSILSMKYSALLG